MTDEVSDWTRAFSEPGTWVGVSWETPAWVGSLSVSRPTEVGGEGLSLEVSDMSPGEAHTWAIDGGFKAFRHYLRVLASVLGGKLDVQVFLKNGYYGDKRVEIMYTGEAVEL